MPIKGIKIVNIHNQNLIRKSFKVGKVLMKIILLGKVIV
jgi:hypothetical protein